ncbi:transporter [Olleya marilimosa]|uniref:Transporter n=1 Tax=Olleya marilimosa TaxID=272164 RepID=A0ABR8LPF3_9FLAO|nr:transporter [Olleya marilimosa]MBD3862086.1 transporter [Olleya marilimosa]MBD3889580.1 transporter [Olleya marilimosa]
MLNPKLILQFTLLLASFTATAQYTEVINSNRPGVSRSAFAVGKNVAQLEVGPYMLKEEHTPLKNEASGFGIDFAARYGLVWEELELNIESTYQNDTFTDNRSTLFPIETDRANFKYLTLGAKYLVYDPYKKRGEEKPNIYSYHANKKFKWSNLIPAVAVYAGVNYDAKDNVYVPYSNPFTSPNYEGGFTPKVMVATQNNFNSGWVLVMNFAKDRIGSDFSDFQYIVTLTKSITDQWVLFGETQGIKSDYYADNLFRFGGAYLWSKDFQLDTAITFNTKDTPSVFSFNFGASYRLDFHKDPEADIDNGTDVLEEYERKANRKKNKNKKDNDSDTPEDSGKRKKETQEIDFDDEN